jgi:hypothetical protein
VSHRIEGNTRVAWDLIVPGLIAIAISLAVFLFLGVRYLKRLGAWLRSKKAAIVVVFLWAFLLSIVVIREYYVTYQSPSAMDPNYRVAFAPAYSTLLPRLYSLDYVTILVMSILAGFAIREIDEVLFGFLASVLLLFVIAVAYTSLYIWYVLGFGAVLDASFATTIIWAAFLNIYRMVFPLAVLAAFLGGIFGSIIRDVVNP